MVRNSGLELSVDLQNLLRENYKRRRIEVLFFEDFESVTEFILEQIPNEVTVGIGNSQTLKGIRITKRLMDKGNEVFDKTLGTTQEEVKKLKKQSLISDVYISSANAISIEGQIVNIDHSGNRIAAITYGPDKVYLIIGKNKIEPTYEEALKRAKNIAAPLNAKRAGMYPPCTSVGYCIDCNHYERVCHYISTINSQYIEGRLTLLIVNEEAGF